ncbi:MAG: DUF4332 domain-containing protein, partial [Pirellulales bacterium]|nr:DUF4332 domain-containing protein [Pirellulales bacterium]
MRITYLYLAGQGAWPNLQMDALAPQLNVLFGPPRAGKSTIAQLASHLLYGKTSSYWRQQFGQMIPRVEGSLGIEARTGSYVLRRHYDSGAEQERARLTIAATSGGKIDSGTVRSLLSGLSPRLALQLFSVDFAESPRIGRLLVDPFAQLLIRQSLQKTAPQTSRTCWNGVFEYRRSDAFDRRRVDELVRQRDILAQELLQLEETIQELLPVPESVSEAQCVGDWRASDVLARLTHGNLVQVWLDRRHHRTYVVDQHGRALSIDSLTSAQYDQLYLALTLALVSSYAQQGIQLPLILDEPFLRQDAAEVEVMAGILDDFACAGHQLLVFTEDHEARRRFASFGTAVFALEELHENRSEVARATTLAVANPVDSPAKLEVTTGTRVVRKSLDGRTAPILRIAKLEGDGDRKDVFYLNESSSWEEFPVLGSETAALFALVDIHSVGDLLAADPTEIARQLCQPDIQCDTVQLWQSHMGLMCHVPELTLHDAQLLTIAGIFSPEQLMDVDLEALSESIEKSLATE